MPPRSAHLRGALLAAASLVLLGGVFLVFFARVLGLGLAGHVYNSDVLHAFMVMQDCFVAALGAELHYRIDLASKDGAAIGMPLTGRLKPYHSIRYVDVLAAAGAPAGDYTDVSATFGNAGPGGAPLVGFCTVEAGASLDAELHLAR